MSRRLFILCGQQSQSGEKLFPARLLFQCSDEELAKRVKSVFVDGALVEDPASAPATAPPLSPRLEPLERMSVTAFSAYLESPYKFYLERVLRAKNCAPDSSEMDNLAFGTLAHEVLQECRNFQSLPEAELRQAMLEALRRAKRRNFGSRPPGLVELQCAMLEDSLEYFARVQHAEYASGWRIVAAERPTQFKWSELFAKVFPEEPASGWRDEVSLSGKIDRIDRKDDDSGVRLRVLDYKTSAKANSPIKAHVGSKCPEWADEEACRADGCALGRDHRPGYWKDLQLPLYVLALRHLLAGTPEFPAGARVEAGYFDLPLDLTSTKIEMFAELGSDETLASAARCADWMLRRIFVERKFEPEHSGQTLELFPECAVAMTHFRAPGRPERKTEAAP